MAADLTTIRTKVRRLTRSPDPASLTDAQIDDYINTYLLYDLPSQLKMFSFRETFRFYTTPFVDTYATDSVLSTNPLFNFKNKYISIHPPIYIAGYQVYYTQSRQEFFGMYPKVNFIQDTGQSGNGITLSFTGTLANAPLLQNNVLFSSRDVNGQAVSLIDVPVVDGVTGITTQVGNLYTPNTQPTTPPTIVDATNTINYETGVYTITFNLPPADGEAIKVQDVPVAVARPMAMLYFDNAFTLRPVPDQAYTIEMEVYVRPTQLLSDTQVPELEQLWQLIAYGAAKKVFEDRQDMDSVASIMPEFKKQEAYALRSTLEQLTNQRTATIYTQRVNAGWNNPWGFGPNL